MKVIILRGNINKMGIEKNIEYREMTAEETMEFYEMRINYILKHAEEKKIKENLEKLELISKGYIKFKDTLGYNRLLQAVLEQKIMEYKK